MEGERRLRRAHAGAGATTAIAWRRNSHRCAGEKISSGFEVGTEKGTFTARSVVAACHVQTTFLQLLDPALCPSVLRRRVEKIKVGNGFGMIVRHAVSELPQYAGQPAGAAPCHSSLQLLCPSRKYLDEAHIDYPRKQPPRNPAVLAMTFSAIDPTLAPPGKHVLFTWAQYHPYELANGENWDAIAEREADKIWEVICNYAPNMRGKNAGPLHSDTARDRTPARAAARQRHARRDELRPDVLIPPAAGTLRIQHAGSRAVLSPARARIRAAACSAQADATPRKWSCAIFKNGQSDSARRAKSFRGD